MVKKTVFLLCCFFVFVISFADARQQPKDSQNPYPYDQQHPPAVCFFPIRQAQWDGFSVTNKNWDKLSLYLKTCFVTESLAEIERNANVTINVKSRWHVLIALNKGVDMMAQDLPGTEMPMIKFLWEVLRRNGFLERREAQKDSFTSTSTYPQAGK